MKHRFLALLGAVVLIAAGVAVPAAPAQAAIACDVTYRTTYWNESPQGGGFQANITIANLGDPINGWTLGFTLPAGQSFRNGWSAEFRGTTGPITASNLPWNARLATGQRVSIGFQGRWTGARTDPTSFTLNGVVCAGAQPVNRPPTATLNSPTSGQIVIWGAPMRMAATASDPDGSVTTVQFFVNDTLVGTDDTAPYEIEFNTGLLPLGGAKEAWARAFDNGSPPLTGDTARVPFQLVSIPPLSVTANPTSLSVPAGGTGFFDLTVGAPTSATVQLTVTGAPGVTVSPTSVSFTAEARTHRVTVTAAPGSGGQVATIRATGTAIVSDPVTVTVLGGPDVPVSNPYLGAAHYVDPEWSQQASDQAAGTPGELGTRMAAVARQPTAVWLDSIAAITRGRGLAGHLDAALAQQRQAGAGAMAIQLVLYNIPGRDCMQRAAPGELTVDPSDQARYRIEFVDRIAAILAHPEYANLRVVVVVEPHALASLVLATGSRPFPPCPDMADPYRTAIRYALNRLAPLSNTYKYLDFSFSGFMGYPDNFGPTADLVREVVMGSGGPGAASVAGFVTNVGQYAPLNEPSIPDPEATVNGSPIFMSRFFDWNREIHELPFAQRVRAALIQRGFPANVGMVIDTGRNGWGGPNRPAGPGTSADLNTWVDQSRIDRRPTRIAWCNQTGSGLGERPRAAPAAGVHAYAWITPPGVSDGVADRAAPADPLRPYLRHRERCHPLFQEPQGALILGNALAGGPHWGRWFPAFFAQLVTNAYPPA
jgi:cellulose 1,4-beta-cellobiosidase